MGLYRLAIDDYETKQTDSLPVYEDGKLKYKVDLQSIDLLLNTDYLIGFKNKYDLIDQCNRMGRDLSNAVDIYIEYKNSGEMKKLPAIFGSYAPLAYFALKAFRLKEKSRAIKHKSEADRQAILDEITNDKNWIELRERFYRAIEDAKFVAFIDPKVAEKGVDFVKYLDHKFTDRSMHYVYDYLNSRKRNTYESIEAYNNAVYGIDQFLTNYRVLRDTILIMREFDRKYGTSYGFDEAHMRMELDKVKKTDSPSLDNLAIMQYGIYNEELKEKFMLDNQEQDIKATYSTEDLMQLYPNDYAAVLEDKDEIKEESSVEVAEDPKLYFKR